MDTKLTSYVWFLYLFCLSWGLPEDSIFSSCSKPVLLIHPNMSDQNSRTRAQHRKGSASQTSEEDVLFKFRLEEALDDEQVAAKLSKIIQSGNKDLLDGLASLRAEVKSLRAELADRDATIVELRSEIQRLREDHDDLEQYGRRNNIRISGIPEPVLKADEVEDTTPAVVALANEVLKVDPPLQLSDIEVSHRLRKPRHAKDNEPRPIIVRFLSKNERYRIISNRKQLKDYNLTNEHPNVYINEDLTSMRAKLFSTVRALHKKRHFQQVWTYNGIIRVKDTQGLVKIIRNNNDIQNCLPNVDLTAALRN